MTERDIVEINSDEGLCFLTKLEKDLQDIFDHLSSKFAAQKSVNVKHLLKKGSIFHKGDFFLSLRNSYIFSASPLKDKLLSTASELPYIRECELDDDGNLILCINRPVLFKTVLNDVKKIETKYGMKKAAEKTFLILVHNEVFKNFDTLRIALIADYLISFLTATGAKVFMNEYRRDAELVFKSVPTFSCTDQCLEQMKLLTELITNSSEGCQWASKVETDSICINLKKFVKTHSISYGNDAESLTINKNMANVVVNQGAYTLHFLHNHLKHNPDCIIHVCSYTQRRKLIDSGLLIEMLDLIDIPQYFVTCQTTICKVEHEVSIDDFMIYQKREIEMAMIHKFNPSLLKKDVWENYMRTLIDTAVKFYFFRAGISVPLKICIPLSQNKDGLFIQYNFARLSNLFKNFETKVEQGYYKKLPLIDEIDFKLLKFEEEWNLLNFIFAFPRLVEEILGSIYLRHMFLVNKIGTMLIKLCSCFSVYYSRIHVLGEPQPQLQKVMHARLWLLKGVHQVIHNSFTLLNLEGLNKM